MRRKPRGETLVAPANAGTQRLARARRYAPAHEIGRAGSRWPLYRIGADARPQTLGELRALQGGGFHFRCTESRPAFLHGDFADGLFPGLPWFLDDRRPQGFLGRAFARRVAGDIDAPEDVQRWHAADVVLALLRHGDDLPGDLVLGDRSLQEALRRILDPAEAVLLDERSARYAQLASAALRGEDVGSPAGGAQPKFAVTLQDGEQCIPVIVKFSDRIDAPTGRRWADLLICEHHAGDVLREHHLAAAHSELIEADGRVFLQSTRFDRTPARGRRGLVSLSALDAAYYGHGRIEWWRFAPQLQRDGWLDADDARALRIAGWFGSLIANTDMHLGNAALQLSDERPLARAPIYDMLPMRFRPATSGEIVERRYEIALPTPGHQDDWHVAAPMALAFWLRVAADAGISAPFRAIAADAATTVRRARAHVRA